MLMPKTPAADFVVRRPASTSVKTSIRCKSRLLTLSQPNLSPPNPELRMGQRHFGFAELRHYCFALTNPLYIRCVIGHTRYNLVYYQTYIKFQNRLKSDNCPNEGVSCGMVKAKRL